MLLSVLSILFLVSISIAASQIPDITCSDVVESLRNLTTEINEPIGQWSVYKTNVIEFACRSFVYESDQLKHSRVAHAFYSRSNGRDLPKLELLYAIVPSNPNQYVEIRKDNGAVTLYHRLHPDVATSTSQFWCGFSCEQDGIYVGNFTCYLANDDAIYRADSAIANAKLPFRIDVTLINSYYDCYSPDPML